MEWIIFARRPLNAVSAQRRIRNGKAMYLSNYFSMKTREFNKERFAILHKLALDMRYDR